MTARARARATKSISLTVGGMRVGSGGVHETGSQRHLTTLSGPRWPDSRARTVPPNLSELCHSSTCMMTFRSPGSARLDWRQLSELLESLRSQHFPERVGGVDRGAGHSTIRELLVAIAGGTAVSPGVIHVTAPRRRSGAGSRGGEGLVAPTTRSSRRHTPGQVTPNDTKRHFRAPFWPIFAVFRARDCAMQPVRTVPNHLSDQMCGCACVRPPPTHQVDHLLPVLRRIRRSAHL